MKGQATARLLLFNRHRLTQSQAIIAPPLGQACSIEQGQVWLKEFVRLSG